MRLMRRSIVFLLLAAAAVCMLFPFFWMISSSLKLRSDIFAMPPVWFPKTPHAENYVQLFTQYRFGSVLLNSVGTAFAVTAGGLLFSAMAGFAFAKYRFRFGGVLFAIVLATLMIPMETGMVPLFLIYKKLGLIDRLIGVVLPRLASGFGIFFMRQYCSSIQNQLLDAARIDGCTEYRLFVSVVLPVLRPALASLGIIFFIEEWNNFLWPTVILRSPDNLTIAVAIRSLEAGVRTPYQLIMSGSVISIVPMLLFILFFQKQLTAGLIDGAVKG
ncbi:hypothetical protein SD70_01490 [Gordoniibacillus kamchatkensis]|uniref:ABC transmembrane type-1 domain-containing protein n=2 Tax=Gordoniibacillus kamchatkensis TaxID=1590651 RepID=A0ABR5ANF0_9BACL|nr:hypothetical protein SD70_01490 [Paenibacillus sp. VKM B-2647]